MIIDAVIRSRRGEDHWNCISAFNVQPSSGAGFHALYQCASTGTTKDLICTGRKKKSCLKIKLQYTYVIIWARKDGTLKRRMFVCPRGQIFIVFRCFYAASIRSGESRWCLTLSSNTTLTTEYFVLICRLVVAACALFKTFLAQRCGSPR